MAPKEDTSRNTRGYERRKVSSDGDSSSSSAASAAFLETSSSAASTKQIQFSLQDWSMALLWPLLLTVPWLLSSEHSPTSYQRVFRREWYEYEPSNQQRPHPLGLSLGIVSVVVGQLWVWLFFYVYKFKLQPVSIQAVGARPYQFAEGLRTHIAQPGGFALLIAYLTITWMLQLLPQSYYTFQGTVEYDKLLYCLLLQDGIQFAMHLFEHVASPKFYQLSHKPHHRFTNPRLFDAFDGSLADTSIMIVIPLYITNSLIHCNVWTYMAFGTMYSSWLTLIHSEYTFPWDTYFRRLGLGTPADHHVHHKYFKYNYGHLFLWFDQLFGTYRDPKDCSLFRVGV